MALWNIGGQNRQEISSGIVFDFCVLPFVLTYKWSQLEEWQREFNFIWLWGLDNISRSNLSKPEEEEEDIFTLCPCSISGPLWPTDILLSSFPPHFYAISLYFVTLEELFLIRGLSFIQI